MFNALNPLFGPYNGIVNSSLYEGNPFIGVKNVKFDLLSYDTFLLKTIDDVSLTDKSILLQESKNEKTLQNDLCIHFRNDDMSSLFKQLGKVMSTMNEEIHKVIYADNISRLDAKTLEFLNTKSYIPMINERLNTTVVYYSYFLMKGRTFIINAKQNNFGFRPVLVYSDKTWALFEQTPLGLIPLKFYKDQHVKEVFKDLQSKYGNLFTQSIKSYFEITKDENYNFIINNVIDMLNDRRPAFTTIFDTYKDLTYEDYQKYVLENITDNDYKVLLDNVDENTSKKDLINAYVKAKSLLKAKQLSEIEQVSFDNDTTLEEFTNLINDLLSKIDLTESERITLQKNAITNFKAPRPQFNDFKFAVNPVYTKSSSLHKEYAPVIQIVPNKKGPNQGKFNTQDILKILPKKEYIPLSNDMIILTTDKYFPFDENSFSKCSEHLKSLGVIEDLNLLPYDILVKYHGYEPYTQTVDKKPTAKEKLSLQDLKDKFAETDMFDKFNEDVKYLSHGLKSIYEIEIPECFSPGIKNTKKPAELSICNVVNKLQDLVEEKNVNAIIINHQIGHLLKEKDVYFGVYEGIKFNEIYTFFIETDKVKVVNELCINIKEYFSNYFFDNSIRIFHRYKNNYNGFVVLETETSYYIVSI